MLEKFLEGDYRQSPDVREGMATLSVLEAALSKAGFGATASQLRDDIQRQQGIHIMCVLCIQYPSMKSCHKSYIVCALYTTCALTHTHTIGAAILGLQDQKGMDTDNNPTNSIIV